MVGTALELWHAMTEIAGNGSDAPAWQIGQQADRNLMGADNAEGKRAFGVIFLVKLA